MQNFETTSRAGDVPSTAPWSGGNGIVTRVDRSGHDSRALKALLRAYRPRTNDELSLDVASVRRPRAPERARARVGLRRARDALVRDENANGRGARRWRARAARRGTRRAAPRLDARDPSRARSREGILAPLTVLTPPREGAAAIAPDDARDDTGAGVRAVGGSESRSATRAPAAVASEFPPTPPLITYEQLAPNVELARVADAAHPRRDRAHAERTLPVLVGWFGCRAGHLRKYAQMYLSKELGYDAVVCVRPPAAATSSQPSATPSPPPPSTPSPKRSDASETTRPPPTTTRFSRIGPSCSTSSATAATSSPAT